MNSSPQFYNINPYPEFKPIKKVNSTKNSAMLPSQTPTHQQSISRQMTPLEWAKARKTNVEAALLEAKLKAIR